MRIFAAIIATGLSVTVAFAQKTAAERLDAATADIHEMLNASDKGIRRICLIRLVAL